MNSNCDALIKKEFLTAEEQLGCTLGADLNILVKNEPISDETTFTPATIKTEALVDTTCLTETVSIKTENSLQNQEVVAGGSFVVYELETQLQKPSKDISEKRLYSIKNPIEVPKTTVLRTTETSVTTNLNDTTAIQKQSSDGITTKLAGPPPILLNAKLRKRHKVIISDQSADKRKRYNIEKAPSALFEKYNNPTVGTIEATKTCRLLNSENRKIINQLIKSKSKQKQQKAEKNCGSAAVIRNTKSQSMERNLATDCVQQMERPKEIIKEMQPITLSAISSLTLPTSLPVITDISNAPKPLATSTILPELRVKCLCSLTGDNTSSDTTEVTDFFKKMFLQTKRLNKTQQRNVKMSLLKAICDAEAAVEKGKCCGF